MAVVRWLVVAMICGLLIWVVRDRIRILGDPNPDIAGIETTFVHAVQSRIDRGTMYADPERTPFEVYQYSPLYFELVAASLGHRYDRVEAIYRTGRTINLIADLLTALLLGWMTWRVSKGATWWAFCVGAVAFALFFAHHFAVRPDAVKTLLVLSAWALVWQPPDASKRSMASIALSALLIALAVFVKQDAAWSAVAIAIFLLVDRERRVVAVFTVTGLLVGVLLLATCHMAYGPWFLQNAVIGLGQGADPYWLLLVVRHFWNDLVAIAVLTILPVWALSSMPSELPKGRTFGVLLLLVLSAASLAKWGSTFVYLTEAMLLLLLLNATILFRRGWLGRPGLLIMAFLMVHAIASRTTITMNRYTYDVERAEADALQRSLRRDVVDRLSGSFTDSTAIITFDKDLCNLLSPHCIFATFEAEYPDLMSCDFSFPTQPRRIFDYAVLHAGVRAGEVDWMIGRGCGRLEAFLEPLDNGYVAVDTMHDYVLYRHSTFRQ